MKTQSEQESHAAFLGALNALGGSAGNGRLRELLEWDEATYQQVKTTLLARGTIVTGRGRGGSVALASSSREAVQGSQVIDTASASSSPVTGAAAPFPNGSSGMATHQVSPPTPTPQPVGGPGVMPPRDGSPLPRRTPPKPPWRRTSGTRPINSGLTRASRRRSIRGQSWG